MAKCINYVSLDEFWQDTIATKIGHEGVKLISKDAFIAGAFAATWLKDHNIDPFDELQRMVAEQSLERQKKRIR